MSSPYNLQGRLSNHAITAVAQNATGPLRTSRTRYRPILPRLPGSFPGALTPGAMQTSQGLLQEALSKCIRAHTHLISQPPAKKPPGLHALAKPRTQAKKAQGRLKRRQPQRKGVHWSVRKLPPMRASLPSRKASLYLQSQRLQPLRETEHLSPISSKDHQPKQALDCLQA